jgi:hypothetical protein
MGGTVAKQFDVESVTLGELMQVEEASGTDIQQLLQSRTGTMMLAVFILHLREHGQPMNWDELANSTLRDVSNSLSQSQQD